MFSLAALIACCCHFMSQLVGKCPASVPKISHIRNTGNLSLINNCAAIKLKVPTVPDP